MGSSVRTAAPQFRLAFADMGLEARAMALEDFLSSQSNARRISLLNKPELLAVEVEAWCVGSGNAIELGRYLGPFAIRRLKVLLEEVLDSGLSSIA